MILISKKIFLLIIIQSKKEVWILAVFLGCIQQRCGK
jgi:hypothetical protein